MNFRFEEPRRFFLIVLFAFIGALATGCGAGVHYRVGIGAGYPSSYYRYDAYPYRYFQGFDAYPYKYRRPYGYGRRFHEFDPYYRPYRWDRRPYHLDKPFRYWDRRPYRFHEPFRHWERRPYGSGVPFRGPGPRFRYRR